MQFCHKFFTKIMQNSNQTVLCLIPCPIAEIDYNWTIPLNVIDEIVKIQSFIVENSKSSRHFLKSINPKIDWTKIEIFELDKHDINGQIGTFKEILNSGKTIGLMSEAGMPCIADPGNVIVRIAHDMGVKVKPFTGPSSILLALISSGMNGQSFKFNGYLPSKPEERKKSISHLEKQSKESTQLFIEAPYRNDRMFEDLINTLNDETRLMIASDLTGANERIISRKVAFWRKNKIEIGKIPCLFGIGI